ncbi:hypothetical protein GCM10010361_54850 [Streptomyces olivaceiscleroticus]|uniref:Uncharacterized protein n=1 Tax=Streptomyces olivaceiscleroticus TaxID=68245 RepID=A0ABP3KMN5_9ACTN
MLAVSHTPGHAVHGDPYGLACHNPTPHINRWYLSRPTWSANGQRTGKRERTRARARLDVRSAVPDRHEHAWTPSVRSCAPSTHRKRFPSREKLACDARRHKRGDAVRGAAGRDGKRS